MEHAAWPCPRLHRQPTSSRARQGGVRVRIGRAHASNGARSFPTMRSVSCRRPAPCAIAWPVQAAPIARMPLRLAGRFRRAGAHEDGSRQQRAGRWIDLRGTLCASKAAAGKSAPNPADVPAMPAVRRKDPSGPRFRSREDRASRLAVVDGAMKKRAEARFFGWLVERPVRR